MTAHRLVMRVVRELATHNRTVTSAGAKSCELLADAAESLGAPWRDRSAARDLVQQVISLTGRLAQQAAADRPLTEALLGRRKWALFCLNQLGDSAPAAIVVGETGSRRT